MIWVSRLNENSTATLQTTGLTQNTKKYYGQTPLGANIVKLVLIEK